MWTFETIEQELPEGARTFEFPIKEGDEQAILMIEQIDGQDGELSVNEISNLPGENLSAYGKVKLFMGNLYEQGQNLTVNLNLAARQYIRITVAKLNRLLDHMMDALPCIGCKKAISLIVTSCLSAVGVPSPNTIEALMEALNQGLTYIMQTPAFETLVNMMRDIHEGLAGIILDVLNGLNDAFGILDRLYEAVCQRLGLCPVPE